MNIIFLDIDGVLNTGRRHLVIPNKPNETFDPVSVGLVNRLAKHTNSEIVTNTVWNINPKLTKLLKANGLKPPVGRTQYPDLPNRLDAIHAYLHEHPADNWVALDDTFIEHKNAVWINPYDGIKWEDYKMASLILGNYDNASVLL